MSVAALDTCELVLAVGSRTPTAAAAGARRQPRAALASADMKTLQVRRLFALAGGAMTGIGSGLAADVFLSGAGESPAFGLFLAGLGLGVMAAAPLRD